MFSWVSCTCLFFFFFNLGKIAAYFYIVQTILWLEKTNEIWETLRRNILLVRGKISTVKWKNMSQFPIKKSVGDVDSPLLTPRKVVSIELLLEKLFSSLFNLLGILFIILKPKTLSTMVINMNFGGMLSYAPERPKLMQQGRSRLTQPGSSQWVLLINSHKLLPHTQIQAQTHMCTGPGFKEKDVS